MGPTLLMQFSRETPLSSVKKDLLKKDRQWQDSLISQHDSLKHLESLKDVPWCKVWDTVLDSGPNAAKYASSVFNILSWVHYLVTAYVDIAPSQSPQISLSLNTSRKCIYQ